MEDMVELSTRVAKPESGDVFAKAVKLSMAALEHALPLLGRSGASAILRHHTFLISQCEERGCVAVVLAVWRRALSDFLFLQNLLDFLPTASDADFSQAPSVAFLNAAIGCVEHSLTELSAEVKPVVSFASPGRSQPIEDRKLNELSIEFVGMAVEFVTMLTQCLARFVDTKFSHVSNNSLAEAERGSPDGRIVVALAPGIHQCLSLAFARLRGEDVLHATLKACSHMVQSACLADEAVPRETFLGLLATQASGDVGESEDKEEAFQRRHHAVSSMVSLGNAMGNMLKEGWKVVVQCLLEVPRLQVSEETLLGTRETEPLKDAINGIFESSSNLNGSALRHLVRSLSGAACDELSAKFSTSCMLIVCRANLERVQSFWDLLPNFWAAQVKHNPDAITQFGVMAAQMPRRANVVLAVLSLFAELFEFSQPSINSLILKEVHKLVQHTGQELEKEAWHNVLRIIECSTKHTAEDVSLGFRILEVVQHGFITVLEPQGLLSVVACLGEFIRQRVAPDRINVNLSAVQLAWSMADFFSSPDSQKATTPLHWSSLIAQLRDGALDERPEVRQSSLKTLMTLVITHGSSMPVESWRHCCDDVLQSLMTSFSSECGRLLTMRDCADPTSPTAGSAAAALKLWEETRNMLIDNVCRIVRIFHTTLAPTVPNYLPQFLPSALQFIVSTADSGEAEESLLAATHGLVAYVVALLPHNLPSDADFSLAWIALEGVSQTDRVHAASSVSVMSSVVEVGAEILCACVANQRRSLFDNYTPRFFEIAEHALNSSAVVTSYTFPSKVQVMAISCFEKIQVHFGSNHSMWQSFVTLLLSLMPPRATVEAAVDAGDVKALPRTFHPAFLAKVCDLWCKVFPSVPEELQSWAAPQAIRALGSSLALSSVPSVVPQALQQIAGAMKAIAKHCLDAEKAVRLGDLTGSLTHILGDLAHSAAKHSSVTQASDVANDVVDIVDDAVARLLSRSQPELASVCFDAIVATANGHSSVAVHACDAVQRWAERGDHPQLQAAAFTASMNRSQSMVDAYLADPQSEEAQKVVVTMLRGTLTSRETRKSLYSMLLKLVCTGSDDVRKAAVEVLFAIGVDAGLVRSPSPPSASPSKTNPEKTASPKSSPLKP